MKIEQAKAIPLARRRRLGEARAPRGVLRALRDPSPVVVQHLVVVIEVPLADTAVLPEERERRARDERLLEGIDLAGVALSSARIQLVHPRVHVVGAVDVAVEELV